MTRRAESAEDRLIARYFRPLATHPGAFGLADDAAAIAPPAGHDLVLKTDGLIARRAFLSRRSGRRRRPQGAAREPIRSCRQGRGAARLSAGNRAAEGVRDGWLAAFARGLGEDADAYGCPLLGGDTDRDAGAGHASRSRRSARCRTARWCGALGATRRRPGVRHRHDRRCGARPESCGGTRGARTLGARRAMREHLLSRYWLPQPRTAARRGVRRMRARRDGRLRRSRRRSRQALRARPACRPRSRWRACRSRRAAAQGAGRRSGPDRDRS